MPHLSLKKKKYYKGLSALVNLEVLDLTNNQIAHLPKNLASSVPKLRQLFLGNNKLTVLREVERLADLKNLTELTLYENPMSVLPHYRDYAIFQLRSIQQFDREFVSPQDRIAATQRFDQGLQSFCFHSKTNKHKRTQSDLATSGA